MSLGSGCRAPSAGIGDRCRVRVYTTCYNNPENYREKVDGTVKAGLIQKWVSLTPNPLVVEPKRSPAKRNPKQTAGFLRIDNVAELQELLTAALTSEWQYVGAMVEAKKIGEIIRTLDPSRTPEEIGYEWRCAMWRRR